MRELLREHGLPGYEVDVAFPDERVAVEVDGWGSHGDRSSSRATRTFAQLTSPSLALAVTGAG